uniref:Tkl protein kinase n=1 Tax=Tetraselmis sp. GSL018 TaxID=582737 RepID=A0A061RBJ4_9CHLO
MWAMRLWDVSYRKLSKEMLNNKDADDSELVRGGSAGLAEVGSLGIKLEGLSRSITNLVAPLPSAADRYLGETAATNQGEEKPESSGTVSSVCHRERVSASDDPDSGSGSQCEYQSDPSKIYLKADSPQRPAWSRSNTMPKPIREAESALPRFSADCSGVSVKETPSDAAHLISAKEHSPQGPEALGDDQETIPARTSEPPASGPPQETSAGHSPGSLLPAPGPGPLYAHPQDNPNPHRERASGELSPPLYQTPGTANDAAGAWSDVDLECGWSPCPGAASPPHPQGLVSPGEAKSPWGAPLVPIHEAASRPPEAPLRSHLAPEALHEIDLGSEIAFGQLVGEGGFGKVFSGAYRGRPVAVKVQNEDTTKASVVEEFRREISTMGALPPHRNVLALIGVSTTSPRLAIVTEFCPLGSLYGMLHSPGCHLSWVQIAYMCLGAANGMVHLHRHKVLHRDLKSANLLVDADYTVKIADFGLSRVQTDLATMTGGLGTFQWMAPEVLGNQRYSEKADVYSFGIVMWECTAREIPYTGMQGMQAALAVMNRGLRPEIPQHTPPALADLMRACWRPIPGERPTMAQVAAALRQIYDGLRHR